MALLVLIPLLGYILLWRRITNSRSSSAALHASSAILATLYIGALGNLLLQITALLLIGGVLLAIYELVGLVRRKELLPTPIGVLLILGGLFVLLHHDATYVYYDEYSHWGIYLKEMLSGNTFWGSESNAMVLRYPPGPPLWQYFFLRFTNATEGGAYFAQFCLLMLPLLVLWQGVKWRQVYWMAGVFALVALTLSNFGHGFASLYVDHVLGAWFAGTIFNFMQDMEYRSPRQLLSYLLPITTLVLIKDAGLYFAAATIGIMALLVFWRTAFAADERKIKDGLIRAGTLATVCIVCAGLVTTSWNANRNAAGIPPSNYSTAGIVSGLTSGASIHSDDEQAELNRGFREVVLHHQISKDKTFASYNEFSIPIMPVFTDRFRLTTASLILLYVLWQIFVILRLAHPEDRWRWTITGAGLVLTAVVYLGILLLSYQFAFDERGIILPSYVRYAHSALFPMVLFVFLPLLPGFGQRTQKLINLPDGRKINRSAAIFTLILGALFIFETPYLTPLYKSAESPEIRRIFGPYVERVRSVVGDARLWVYLPVPDANGQLGRIILHDIAPVRAEVEMGQEFLANDIAAIQEVVANWDYLWFPVEHPQMDEQLKFLFGEDLKDRVFRVDRSDGNVEVVALDGIFDGF